MAIGYYVSGLESFLLPGLSSSFSGCSITAGDVSLAEGETVVGGGSVQDVRPLPAFPDQAFSGAKVKSFLDDFYNRVHFNPMSISFGVIADDMSTIVQVWSAYTDRSVTLSSIDLPGDQGVVLGGAAVPTTFKPLQSKSYTVTAKADGPASLRANLTWAFDIPWSFSLLVSGTRLKLWPYKPNWSDKYAITYSFLTEIFTSRNGKEQRRALRTTPRKTLEYPVLLHGSTFRTTKDLMWSWGSRAFVLPELPRFLALTSAMPIDSFVAFVDRVSPEFQVGATVLLSDGLVEEIRTIKAVDPVGLSVTFDTNSPTEWPAGARIYFGLTGYMDTSQSVPRRTNTVAELSLVFNVDPTSEPYVVPAAPSVMFNGREVFLKKPNWAESVDVSFEHDVDPVDYARGPVVRFEPVAFAREIKKATYLGKTFAEAEEIRQLFFRMKGRRGEFYMPSGEPDITPVYPVQSNVAFLRIKGYDFYDAYAGSTVNKAVSVMLSNGTYIFRKVLSVDKVSDSQGTATIVTVQGTWGVQLTEANVAMISWLFVRRFASDELTIEWLTNTVAQVAISTQTLEDLPAEVAPT